MILRKTIQCLGIIASLCLVSCGESEKDEEKDEASEGELADSDNPGAAINDISVAMGSIQPASLGLGGVASTYCSENGEPLSGGSDMDNSSDSYAAATGYCQLTQNSQSPDTPRGAMYLAGAIGCFTGEAGLFDDIVVGTANTGTKDLVIEAGCWGTAAEAAAMAQIFTFALTDLILVALIVWDWRTSKRKDVFLPMLFVLLVLQLPVFFFVGSPTWGAFAEWYMQLPIS